MTNKQRFHILEGFLHQLDLNAQLFNSKKITEAVTLINAWSYAHRCGNGENSEYEQQKIIDRQYQRLKDYI